MGTVFSSANRDPDTDPANSPLREDGLGLCALNTKAYVLGECVPEAMGEKRIEAPTPDHFRTETEQETNYLQTKLRMNKWGVPASALCILLKRVILLTKWSGFRRQVRPPSPHHGHA